MGAGGATAYYSMPDVQAVVRSIITSAASTPRTSAEVESLQRLVEQLTRELRTNNAPSISIVSPHAAPRASTTLYALGALAALAAYLRYLRGWSWGDMWFVSRASLDALDTRLRDAMTRLDQQVIRIRDHLLAQLDALSTKQDAALEAHDRLAAQLRDAHGEVQDVHRSVRALEDTMRQLGGGVAYANQGIHVLCKVVGQLLGDAHGVQIAELDEYVKLPTPVTGLGVLCDASGERVLRAATMPAELMLDCERDQHGVLASRRPPSSD